MLLHFLALHSTDVYPGVLRRTMNANMSAWAVRSTLAAFVVVGFSVLCQCTVVVDVDPYGTSTRYLLHPHSITVESPPSTGCSIRSISFIGRHGIRNPSKSNLRQLHNLEAYLKDVVEESRALPIQLSWLRKWRNPIAADDASQLVADGAEISKEIGKRLYVRYPHIFQGESDVRIYSSKKQRCLDTARSLLEGVHDQMLPNRESKQMPLSVTVGDERLVRVNHACTRQKEYESSLSVKIQLNNYIASHYPSIAGSLARQLGIANLNETVVGWFWTACKMEVASLNRTDGFCSLFSMSQKEAILRSEDIKYYDKLGPGNPYIKALSCPLIADVLKSWNLSGESGLSNIYITHDGTILPFITSLGIMQKTHSKSAPLSWRVSEIAPMSANVILELWACPDGEKYVRTLHNEKPTTILGCEGSSFCPLQTFLDHHGHDEDRCTNAFSETCFQ